MRALLTVVAVVLALTSPSAAPAIDVEAAAAAFKTWDAGYNNGLGHSDKADSGSLGWGEATFLRNYAAMWEATADPYWLGKIEDHFGRMIGNATDPDGDGFLGWQTSTYSCGYYQTLALHNVSAATIEPAEKRETNGDVAKLITGHTYIIEFIDANSYRAQDQNTRQWVSEALPYKSGEAIKAVPGCTVTIKGDAHSGDKFMLRTVAREPTEFTVHEGMCAYPVALFIEAALTNEGLQERFADSARRFLEFMNKHFCEKHEQHWLDMGDGAGAYRFMDLITDRFPNRIMPHNQYLALARAFLVLKDLPGAHPLMGPRAEAMARYFKRYIRVQDAGYTWNYWDWIEKGEPGGSGIEDTSHGTIDVGFAVDACRRGVVFTEEDMLRFTRTYLDLLWDGSEDNPQLGARIGSKTGKHPAMLHDWVDLCQWDGRIFDLALTSYLARKSPVGEAPAMLVAQKRRQSAGPQ